MEQVAEHISNQINSVLGTDQEEEEMNEPLHASRNNSGLASPGDGAHASLPGRQQRKPRSLMSVCLVLAFVAAGLVIFIASAKMAIDPNVVRAKLSGEQLVNMQDMIKHQIRRSMKATVKMQKKMQKKDVKSRDSDTQEVKTLEGKVAGLESIVSKLVKSEKVLVKTDVKAARRQPAIIIARNHGDGGGSAEGAPREDMPADERREVQVNRADWRQSERRGAQAHEGGNIPAHYVIEGTTRYRSRE